MALSQKEIEIITVENYDKVYKYCVSRCRNIDDAFDITQEVFCTLLKKSSRLKNIKMELWLMSVADNKLSEYFRSLNKKQSFVSFDECITDFKEVNEEDFELVEDFESLLNETQKKIMNILTEKEKAVFVKRFLEHKSISIVAEEIGISKNNVSVISSRIKKKAKSIIFTSKLLICILSFMFYGLK